MRSSLVRSGATIALITPQASGAQTRAFVVKLGADTLAVEPVTRTGDRVEGSVVRHLQDPGVLRNTTFITDGADLRGAHVTITYGRPSALGREIWGRHVPYDTTWRRGANVATALI